MSREPDLRSGDEARVRDAVRDLPRPAPDPGFRARLKRDFVSGQLGAPRTLVLARPWYRRPAWALALAPAALVVAIAIVALNDRGSGWSLMMARGNGALTVDGAPVALTSRADLDRALHPGARVAVPAGAEVELMSASGMVMQITSGTELTLPGTPGRWMHRRVAGTIGRGEIRVTTGSAFRGARLALRTPEAMVEITGTTFAVICEPTGTCVCVREGVVRVGAPGGAMEMVPAGRRRYLFNDGRAPENAEIRPVEAVQLGEFRASRSRWLEQQPR